MTSEKKKKVDGVISGFGEITSMHGIPSLIKARTVKTKVTFESALIHSYSFITDQQEISIHLQVNLSPDVIEAERHQSAKK